LREERRLRVFENGVLRRIFGPKRDEVTGKWKKLLSDELYSSPNIVRMIKSRRMGWAGHVTRMGKRKIVYRVWWGNVRERDHWGHLGIDGRINIKMDLQEVGYGSMDWIELAQDWDKWRALVKCGEFLDRLKTG